MKTHITKSEAKAVQNTAAKPHVMSTEVEMTQSVIETKRRHLASTVTPTTVKSPSLRDDPNPAATAAPKSTPMSPKAKILSALTLFLTLICFSSCSEIISPDISTHEITLVSPADSLFTNNPTISFWWEDDEAIEHYQLRITSGPSSNLTLVLDTSMVANSISLTLSPDFAYNWRVYGKNEGSETDPTNRYLFVDQTTPEKATATTLDGDTLAATATGTLQWTSSDFPLAGTAYPVADSLIIYRRNDSTTIGAKYYFPETATKELNITATSPTPFNGPGTYFWRIRTIDRAGNKNLSDFFQFTIQ